MENNKNFLGVDLGTSSIKVILCNQKGEVLSEKSGEYNLKTNNLEATQNPEDWFIALSKCIKSIMRETPSIKIEAISFSGQMHGLVMIDKFGKLISDSILWNDQRSYKEVEEIKKKISIDKILKESANMPIEAFILPKLIWLMKNKPNLYKRIYKILSPKDYLIYRLCNEYVTDVTDASGSGMFNVKDKKWSKFMINKFNINYDILPKVFESYEKVGVIKKEISKEMMLRNNPVIIIGAGDQAANAIGLGVINKNQLALSLGTSACVFSPSDVFSTNENLHSFNHSNGKYHLMGVSQSGGGSIKWFFEEILKSNNYKEIENINFNEQSNTFFLPYLTGERHPIHDPLAKAVFFGMDRSTDRSQMIKSVLEGVVFSINHIVSIIKKSQRENFKEMMVAGGGGNNSYWMNILSSMLNMEVKTVKGNYGGAIGAAIIAMVGVGEYTSFSDAVKRILKIEKTYKPKKELHKLFVKKYEFWLKIYPKIKSLYFDLQADINSASLK